MEAERTNTIDLSSLTARFRTDRMPRMIAGFPSGATTAVGAGFRMTREIGMRETLTVATVLMAAMPCAASAQQVDMAAIQKWSSVKVVRYKVDARFDGWTQVAVGKGGEAAQGKATDSYALEFDWDTRGRKLAGPVSIRNGKSVVAETRDKGNCAKPVLKGEYEHFEATEAKVANRDLLELKGTRAFPAAQIANECPASKALNPVAADRRAVTESIAVPDPKMMSLAGIGNTGNPRMTFSPDKQSFIMRMDNGWTLTYTPSVVK